MSMQENFGFEKLNRVPKKIIQEAVEESKILYPNCALNRNHICEIIARKLVKAYLKEECDDFKLNNNSPDTVNENNNAQTENNADSINGDVKSSQNSEDKKNYNGQHILKKMDMDTTQKILRKIDFYIYRYYTN